MRRLCGRSAIAAAPVSSERERGNERWHWFQVYRGARRREERHTGRRQRTRGAQAHAVREAGRHVRTGTTARRAACLGAWLGCEAQRAGASSQGWPVAAHGPKFGPTMVEDAPIGWVRTGREKNKEEGEMRLWRKMGRASWAFPLMGRAGTRRGGATCTQVVEAE
jgi:hypothetical protein